MLKPINRWWIEKLKCSNKCGTKEPVKYTLHGQPVCNTCALKLIGMIGAKQNMSGEISWARGNKNPERKRKGE